MRPIGLPAAILIALLFIKGMPAECQSQSTAQSACPDEVDTSGKYVNYSYGFSIIIPEGLKGTWNSARCVADNDGCVCMSDHGRTISLSDGPGDTDHWIEAYAGFAADLDEPTLQAEVNKRLDWVRERSTPGSVWILKSSDVRIGGIRAKRVVVRYQDKQSDRLMIEDFVEALRGRSEVDVQYSVYLRSPADAYERDKRYFNQVLSSFAMTHCDHC